MPKYRKDIEALVANVNKDPLIISIEIALAFLYVHLVVAPLW